jgi:hypothetical protein
MLHDQTCREAVEGNPNLLVPWYLMASWAYYIEDDPILSDGLFDYLCTKLDAAWDTVEHWHKPVVSRGDLSAGSCLLKQSDFPQRVVGAVHQLRRDGGKPPPKQAKPKARKVLFRSKKLREKRA